MRRTLPLAALAALLLLAAPAGAVTKNGITPVTPKAGDTIPSGRAFVFKLNVKGPSAGTFVARLQVEAQGRRRRHLLEGDDREGEAQAGLALRVQGEVLRLPGLLAQLAGDVLLAGLPHALRRGHLGLQGRGADREVQGRVRWRTGPSGSAARAGTTRTGAGGVYPEGLPPRRWLAHYATRFDTVEVNSTFYRLARPAAVARWVEETPDDFRFTVKASRYLTHVKRLQRHRPRDRAPLRGDRAARGVAASSDRCCGSCRRTSTATTTGWPPRSSALPPGRHAFEFRHASWFRRAVFGLLHTHGAALVIGDDKRRPLPASPLTADWTLIRFHYGTRGRRGNYTETRAPGVGGPDRRAPASEAEVLAYFNNDWEGFAVRNGLRLKRSSGLEARMMVLVSVAQATRGGAVR